MYTYPRRNRDELATSMVDVHRQFPNAASPPKFHEWQTSSVKRLGRRKEAKEKNGT
jgi:hypothetical protein